MDPTAQFYSYLKPRFILETQEIPYETGTFLRDTFFKDREFIAGDQIALEVRRGTRRLAPFIIPYGEPAVVEQRTGYKTMLYDAPWISPSRVIDIPDLNRRDFGDMPFGMPSPEDKFAALVARDTREMGEEIDRTEEWMCSSMLINGSMTINFQTGIEPYVLNYNFSNKIIYSPSNYWTANVNPIPALVQILTTIGRVSGQMPDTLVMAANVGAAFLGNTVVSDYLKAVGSPIINFDLNALKAAGVSYMGRLPMPGLDLLIYTGGYTDKTGAYQPFIPDDTVLLANSNGKNKIRYAWVQQWEEDPTSGRKSFNVYMKPRVPKTIIDVRSNAAEYILGARPFPIPWDSLSWAVLTVMNSSGATLTPTSGF